MNLKILNILLCVLLSNILGNCTLSPALKMEMIFSGNKTLTFGRRTLEELKSDPDFIAAYGSIPLFKARKRENSGWISLIKYMPELMRICVKSMYPDGPVTEIWLQHSWRF